jgi:hypothetical protein
MEMNYVREYTPTFRFLKIINSTLTGLVDYFYESTVGVYPPLHYLASPSHLIESSFKLNVMFLALVLFPMVGI